MLQGIIFFKYDIFYTHRKLFFNYSNLNYFIMFGNLLRLNLVYVKQIQLYSFLNFNQTP